MTHLINYLIQSSACLSALYLLYLLFLRKETFFMVNRIYLILVLLFSMVLPLIPIRLQTPAMLTSMMVFLDPVLITPEKVDSFTTFHFDWLETAGVIYLAGVIIFSLRFFIQIIQLQVVIHRNGIIRRDRVKFVFLDKGLSPFSFFNLIFIRKEPDTEHLGAILQHELVHVRQWHSIDLILVELLTIIQWFNPFAWLLQRSVRSLHEFLADEGVIREGVRQAEYQQLIFNYTLGRPINNLTTNFNVSLIQKRIIMMTKSRSRAIARMKYLLAIPVVALSMFYLSTASAIYVTGPTIVQPNTAETILAAGTTSLPMPTQGDDSIYQKAEKSPEYPGGDQAFFEYLVKNIHYPDKAKENKVMGTVFVNFIVEKNGAITHVKVLKGIGSGCDEEAVRVVSQMAPWKPGQDKGKPVRVGYVLPIKFSLDDSKEKEKEEQYKQQQEQDQQKKEAQLKKEEQYQKQLQIQTKEKEEQSQQEVKNK